MAAYAHLSREERIGLGIAAAAHVALVAVLVFYDKSPANIPPPERMEVSLADEISLKSTAPDPAAQPQAAVAPELSPEPAPVPEPEPSPVERVEPERVTQPPQPRVVATPTPAPRPTASTRPKPAPTPTPKPSPTKPARSGGSRIGSDFLEGTGASEGADTGTQAAEFGATEQAALSSAINRQLKPHWSAPQGVDAEKLVTVLSWELNPDGSLKGPPKIVSQSGITDSNRPQAKLHAERAMRAVQLAAPFDLPPEFYDKWKRIREWRFDRKL